MRESNRNANVPKFVSRIELVQKRSIMHYQQQESHPFLKIVVALPTMVASCRGKKFHTFASEYIGLVNTCGSCSLVPFFK